MLFKEISNSEKTKTVSITRSKNTASSKYDYYLTLFSWCPLNGGSWVVNEGYKQIKEISNSAAAIKTAKDLLKN